MMFFCHGKYKMMCVFKKIVKTREKFQDIYGFQYLTTISGHFSTNVKMSAISGISGQRPGLH